MTPEESERLLAQDYMFHVTRVENMDSIKSAGLDPSFADWDAYRGWLKQPAVFFCTKPALESAKAMFDDGIRRDGIVVRMSAAAVAQHECDVDHSFPQRTKGLNFLECLEQVGCIACYGHIPPDAIEVVERQNHEGKWEEE